MSLRRLAQANNAGMNTGSPQKQEPKSTNNSPRAVSMTLPRTPQSGASVGAYRSPASTPSISSSIPFDWEAARARKPAPYGTPGQKNKVRLGTPVKRVVRKRGVVERMMSIPSRIAFEIALFPHNVPLPEAATSGRLVGGVVHFLHFCVRVSQSRKVPDSDLGWEDMYHEDEGTSWFDWTTPVTVLLLGGAILNAVYLFTRIRLYRLHRRAELVSSPNARFVSAQLDFEPLEVPSVGQRVRSGAWYIFSYCWRWLLGLRLPTRGGQAGGRTARVQQLEVWAPGGFETVLFTVYSPAHGLLWMGTGTTNWMAMGAVMLLVWAQLDLLVCWYAGLVKDREIIAAEVMHEYNDGFVYPRVMPLRRDAAVMTHEAEIVHAFDANGLPRRDGCPRRHACRFTHPDHPAWATAASPSPAALAKYNRRTTLKVTSSTSTAPVPATATAAPATAAPATAPTPSTTPPTMHLLPPLPTPPNALCKQPAPHKTQEQLRALWEERIKQVNPLSSLFYPSHPRSRALAESTNRRHQLAKLEAEITNTRALINSLQYSSLPDDSKSRIADELAQLERRRDQVKKQREDAINDLIKADSWPAAPLTDAHDKELDKYREMKKSVAELRDQVQSINSLFLKLADDKVSGSDAMDLDQDAPSRPLKRRRVAESGVVPEDPPGPTQDQLEAMQRKITELDSTYLNLTNDVFARDADLQQRIESEVELQLDNTPPPDTDAFARVTAEIKQSGEEVGMLAKELGELMLQAENQKNDLETVRARIAASQAQFQEMRNKFQTLEQERQKDLKTIAALEEAVKVYTEDPPQPAVPGLTHDQIVHLMDEPLTDIVRAHIRPLLQQLRDKVQDMLNVQNEEMYRALWGKLSLTLRMVESISRRLERVERVDPGSASPAQNV